ncbi:MAG: AtpZ/AtpI family protein [Candidatus Cloacimonetes bacterium]|nr:AtpZ/AtpI family protein [Candidatus Cloacimonadota bacterium]
MRKFIKADKEILQYLSLITQLGLTVIVSIMIFFFLFLYLDRKFQTKGILIAIGTFLGVISGIYNGYTILKKFYEKSERN